MIQKRKTSTKEDIKEALIQLLSEERFDTISISFQEDADADLGAGFVGN